VAEVLVLYDMDKQINSVIVKTGWKLSILSACFPV